LIKIHLFQTIRHYRAVTLGAEKLQLHKILTKYEIDLNLHIRKFGKNDTNFKLLALNHQ